MSKEKKEDQQPKKEQNLAEQLKIQLMYDSNILAKKSGEDKANDQIKKLKRRLKNATDENYESSL